VSKFKPSTWIACEGSDVDLDKIPEEAKQFQYQVVTPKAKDVPGLLPHPFMMKVGFDVLFSRIPIGDFALWSFKSEGDLERFLSFAAGLGWRPPEE
jgi:hypothetical protein